MKMNEITEGFWDDIKSGYKAGQKDYISRRAKELGITPQAAACLLYTSPSPRDGLLSRMPSSA